MTDETSTPLEETPVNPTPKLIGDPSPTANGLIVPSAKEDVHEYSGVVHPFPNHTGNANVSE